jgi:hypothetical protein
MYAPDSVAGVTVSWLFLLLYQNTVSIFKNTVIIFIQSIDQERCHVFSVFA